MWKRCSVSTLAGANTDKRVLQVMSGSLARDRLGTCAFAILGSLRFTLDLTVVRVSALLIVETFNMKAYQDPEEERHCNLLEILRRAAPVLFPPQ